MNERNQSNRLRFESETQSGLAEGITSSQLGSRSLNVTRRSCGYCLKMSSPKIVHL